MIRYIVTDDVTGKILSHGTTASLSHVVVGTGATVRENTWEAESGVHYWDGTEPQTMARMADTVTFSSFTLNSDLNQVLTISGIPLGTVIMCYGEKGSGQEVIVNDGTFIYDSDIIGEHLFALIHPTYVNMIDAEVTVI